MSNSKEGFIKYLIVQLLQDMGVKFEGAPKFLRDIANDFEKILKEED